MPVLFPEKYSVPLEVDASSSYLAEKCPIINRLTCASRAIVAACSAVECMVCLAQAALFFRKSLRGNSKSIPFICSVMREDTQYQAVTEERGGWEGVVSRSLGITVPSSVT